MFSPRRKVAARVANLGVMFSLGLGCCNFLPHLDSAHSKQGAGETASFLRD